MYVSFYMIHQMLFRKRKYSLVLMLEPLPRYNLKCPGCGKIQFSVEVPDTRLTVDECIGAADEANAPIVSLRGGEPLLHPDIPEIVARIASKRRFVYLCTNAILLENRIDEFEPSPFLTFNVHLDGMKDRHDALVGRKGVFVSAVNSIGMLIKRGFRVTTNTTIFSDDTPENVARLFDFLTAIGVDGMTVAPAFNSEAAPDRSFFRDRAEIRNFFRRLFQIGRYRNWEFNHSGIYLDFLAGRRDIPCTPWGSPTRNVFGWQRPCHHINDGYAASYDELLRDTDWEACGFGRNPKCGACMDHSGYEPTAVAETLHSPLRLLEWMQPWQHG